jgi:hypothetical protein
MRSASAERTVFVLAGEYSAAPDDLHPVSVFEKARSVKNPGKALEDLMSRAGERALNMLSLGDEGRLRIDQLLMTTMPDVGGSAMAHAIHLPNVLKRRLQLAEACQARFEVGSSDAGASLFASAVHLLKGLDAPSTALVVAGQIMPGGRDAIQTVSQVLDAPERALGVTMIAVGDLLLDLEAWQWRQELGRRLFLPGLAVGEAVADVPPPPPEAFAAAVEAMVRHKLALSVEYPAAQRRGNEGGPAGAAPISRWMTDWHLALASNGACAVVLTTDEALVRKWLAATGQRRAVRVLGVGEGDADPRLAMRAEPFGFFKSLRQALVSLRRNTDTNHDFLRSSAFAVLHDAFPSIEHAFLLGLGFSPAEAMRRSRSYWPNPYGGLTAFGHALAASGLVQIAKAFHVFTQPEAYIQGEPGPLHPDCRRTSEAMHCVTTSVGGPLSHIVATLLQSCPVDEATFDPQATPHDGPLLEPFRPRKRHRLNDPSTKAFEAKTRWVSRLAARYREALAAHGAPRCAPGCDAAVVEARTHFDLRLMQLPLPEAFRRDHATSPAAAAALAAADVDQAREALRAHLPAADDAAREAAERRLWANMRLPVAVVTGPAAPDAEPGTVRGFALVTDTAAPCGVGDLVEVEHPRGGGYPIVRRVFDAASAPALVPLWYRGLSPVSPESCAPLLDPAQPVRYADADDAMQETTVMGVLSRLVAAPLDPDVTGQLQALGTLVVERLLLRPDVLPPNGAVRLLHELVLQPEPSRFRLITALRELTGLENTVPAPVPELLAYCEFDLLDAAGQDDAGLILRMNMVSDALRRADGWLAGAQVTHGRVGDAFAVTVRQPVSAASAWRSVLRFARDVHHSCRAAGILLRSGVCVGPGVIFPEAYGRIGAAGDLQKAVHLTLEQADPFRRGRPGEAPARRDGLAIVVTQEADAEAARARCDALWAALDEGGLTGVRFDALPAAGAGVFFDIRRF